MVHSLWTDGVRDASHAGTGAGGKCGSAASHDVWRLPVKRSLQESFPVRPTRVTVRTMHRKALDGSPPALLLLATSSLRHAF